MSIKLNLKHVGVLHHPRKPESFEIGTSIVNWLTERGIESWRSNVWDEADCLPHIPETDMLITLGGDGSMLRAGRMSAGHDVPVIGLNMGRLGFLSEMEPANWADRLAQLLAGHYWVERRMMLDAETWRNGTQVGSHLALNDVVISRGTIARVVRLRVEIDGEKFTTYAADGIIISTPTGSTAYALAAGGPILPPELRNILVLPIAPHLTLDRSLVLAEGSTVRVYVLPNQQAVLTVDGQTEFDLNDGDFVDIRSSEHASYFVRLGKRNYFYNTLLERLEPKHADSHD